MKMIANARKRLLSSSRHGTSAIQIDEGTILVYDKLQSNPCAVLETSITLQGVSVDSNCICCWSNCEIQIYALQNSCCETLAEIPISLQALAIHGKSLYIAQNQSLLVTDLDGTLNLKTRLSEKDGRPQFLYAISNVLTVCTDNGTIKVMNISKKEPRTMFTHEASENSPLGQALLLKTVNSLQTNADGSLISVTCSDRDGRYLYLIESSSGKVKALQNIAWKHCTMTHRWDSSEPKVVAIEVLFTNDPSPRIVTLFIDNELDAHIHEDIKLQSSASTIIGLSIPHISTFHGAEQNSEDRLAPETLKLERMQLPGFEDCSLESPAFISSMTDYLFNLTIGNIEKAFVCASRLKKDQVWKSLASACIHHEKFKLASKCFQHVRREEIVDPRDERMADISEFALADTAIHLGMIQEAEFIYRKNDRLDLLCDLLRKQGSWSEAFELARDNEIMTKSLNFFYAKAMEDKGDLSSALVYYEKSSLTRRNLLQKMLQNNIPVDDFLKNQNKNELTTLYAMYVESLGDVDHAKTLYSAADDSFNSVRLSYLEGDIDHSFQQAELGCTAATSYYLAQRLEDEGEIVGSLKLYQRAVQEGSIPMSNHAIQLCKEFENDNLLFEFALKCQKPQLLSCAQYLTERGNLLKSAQLFMEGGDNDQAIEIALQISFNSISNTAQKHEYVSMIDALCAVIPDDTIKTCAKFLIEVDAIANVLNFMKRRGSSVQSIMQFCADEKIHLDEERVDLILSGDVQREQAMQVADECKSQGDFEMACRAFTKAGESISAVRCLLRSGNVKKILDYTNESQKKEVYILAANYLQTLDYEQDSQLKKHIFSFYRKAFAHQQLVSLLVGWSENESGDGDYEMACRWLEEALENGQQIENWKAAEEYKTITEAMKEMRFFLAAKEFAAAGSFKKARMNCRSLLQGTAEFVQAGDVYGLLIDIENDNEKSYGIIEEMIERKIEPRDFLDVQKLEQIYKALNKEWKENASMEDDDHSYESLESTGVLALNEEEQLVLDSVSSRNWKLVRELLAKCGRNLSLRLVCCIFSAGPPQSVAVEIMRVKASLFLERDDRDRYALHYLCLYGASVYTTVFTVQQCKAALEHKDADNKTPLDYVMTSSWHFCEEEKEDVLNELERIKKTNLGAN